MGDLPHPFPCIRVVSDLLEVLVPADAQGCLPLVVLLPQVEISPLVIGAEGFILCPSPVADWALLLQVPVSYFSLRGSRS